jgi:hypothetical protein
MGNCMRKPDKKAEGGDAGAVNGHGQGRDMGSCSEDWKKAHPKKAEEAKK